MSRREPIRVLVADDSVTMRTALVAMLGEEQDLRIVGQARDGLEAVEKARALRPDVITMDVNMPRLDGLGATAAIMAESPSRVLMVCAVSEDRQLDLSFRAMAAGALEVISKPGPAPDELRRFGRRVAEAVRLMAEVPVVRRHRASEQGLLSHAASAGVG
ncbi:MAG: response regulator, partial [Deltaproteobacteria bacterium]